MTPDYPHITKSLDTITPISADMGGYFTTEPHRLVSLSTHQSEARSLG